MMNYNLFERELEAMEADPQRDTELIRLRNQLRDYADETQSRSPLHQSASWTRLRSRLKPERQTPLFQRFLAPAALPALAGIILGLWLLPSQRDAIGKTDAPNIEISNREPTIYVTPFHSKSVNADVIWAEGYQYIPASHTLR